MTQGSASLLDTPAPNTTAAAGAGPTPKSEAHRQLEALASHADDVSGFWRHSSGSTRAMRYLSLLYTGFWLIQPIYEHSWEKWLSFGLTYTVFLALYFLIPVARGRQQQILLGQMFMLAFGYYPFNQSACGVFVYPIVFLAFITESMQTYVAILLVQCVGITIEAAVFHLQWWTALMAIFFSLVVGFSNFAYTRQQRAAFQLARANDEIEHLAQVAERERIARDLHDLLGHTLTVIAIKSELANRLLAVDPGRAAHEMQEVEQTARKALAEVREAVTGYRSEGIAAEVQRARRTLLAAGVQLTVSMEPLHIEPAHGNALCLALREGVTNIVRHAKASAATLRIETEGANLRMSLQDDGVGVPANSAACSNGHGLRGMRERIQQVGGTVSIARANLRGTVIVVCLPIQQRSPAFVAAGEDTQSSRVAAPSNDSLKAHHA